MTKLDEWTVKLAMVLAGDVAPEDRATALQTLADSHVTGQPEVDLTRQRILHLLAQREGVVEATEDLASPAAPLGPLQPEGRAGISLVAVDLSQLTVAAIRNWLTAKVDEVVLVDCHTTPALAQRLTEAGITDPRLTVIRLDQGDVTWTQAFNIGLRAARHARLWAISGSARLGTLPPQPLQSGSYAAETGQSDAVGFLLDLHRGDLAAVGGFNEYLDSPDWSVEDLADRLSAHVLQRRALPAGLLVQGPKPSPADAPVAGTLRESLRQAQNFVALQNRFISAAMPDWVGADQLPYVFGHLDEQGQHVQPGSASVAKVPLHIKTEAASHALIDLLRDRLGGQPERLSPRRLDMVLARPTTDVTAVDIAVAASNAPDGVRTRKGWLVLDVNADTLPLPGTAAAVGLSALLQMAQSHGQTVVLRVDTPETAAMLTSMTAQPVVTGAVDTTPFWPTELRELARPLGDRAPRHATMAFNEQTLTDLGTLSQTPALLLRRPKIFIDAQHGLGNRMRAIASAGAIAAGTDRELVIIWQPDAHCDCLCEDLFFPHGAVLTQGFATEAQDLGMQVFNYMEVEPGAVKDAPIIMGGLQDVYIRSAYPLVSPCSNWHTENLYIRNLQPNQIVRALVSSVRNPNDVSVHIRMEGGAEVQHLPYESALNWTVAAHQDIVHWRKRSHFKFFLPRLDQLIAQGIANKVFLATDTPAVQAEFERRYGSRVVWLPRPSSDRSSQSMVYALADAILLGRAPRLLGSNWSSFSELAARLSAAPMTVELTGRDF